MSNSMETLYLYAQERPTAIYLAQEEGYYVRLHREDEYEKHLRALLDESGQKLLNDLLRTKINLSISNERAAFQSGFRTALELLH